jgi:hypothetical protein
MIRGWEERNNNDTHTYWLKKRERKNISQTDVFERGWFGLAFRGLGVRGKALGKQRENGE